MRPRGIDRLRRIPRDFALVLRTSAPSAALDRVRTVIRRLDPQRPLNDVMSMSEVIEERLTGPRLVAGLLAALGGLALLLAVVGLYGVIGYSVSQRTHEIGLRVMLGAKRRDVVRLVVGQAARLTVVGIGTGAVLAFALAGLSETVVFGIAPFDAAWLAAVAFFVALIGLAAAYAPARRALAIHPAVALRQD